MYVVFYTNPSVNMKKDYCLIDDVDLNIPCCEEDLLKAKDAIKALQIKFLYIKNDNQMNDYWHDKLYEDNSRILAFVGSLSKRIFNVEDKLEKLYTERYIKTPRLAKHFWYVHYENLHHPFTSIKNKCWRLFDELDKEYRRTNDNQNPPNWDHRLYDTNDTNVQSIIDIDDLDLDDDYINDQLDLINNQESILLEFNVKNDNHTIYLNNKKQPKFKHNNSLHHSANNSINNPINNSINNLINIPTHDSIKPLDININIDYLNDSIPCNDQYYNTDNTNDDELY